MRWLTRSQSPCSASLPGVRWPPPRPPPRAGSRPSPAAAAPRAPAACEPAAARAATTQWPGTARGRRGRVGGRGRACVVCGVLVCGCVFLVCVSGVCVCVCVGGLAFSQGVAAAIHAHIHLCTCRSPPSVLLTRSLGSCTRMPLIYTRLYTLLFTHPRTRSPNPNDTVPWSCSTGAPAAPAPAPAPPRPPPASPCPLPHTHLLADAR